MLKIGHIDRALDVNHPALLPYLEAYRFWEPPGDSTCTIERIEKRHGTHTAGILCGISCYKQADFHLDMALYSAGATEGQDNVRRILQAMEWMYELEVRILCLPFGIKGNNPVFRPMIRRLTEQGTLVIAAIGNDGPGSFRTPGCYTEVLTIGACNYKGIPSSFSGYYHCLEQQQTFKPEILANGEDIFSTFPDQRYQTLSGTSQACAVAARQAIHLLSASPHLSAEQLKLAFIQSSQALTNRLSKNVRYGYLKKEMIPPLQSTTQATIYSDKYLSTKKAFRNKELKKQLAVAAPDKILGVVVTEKGTSDDSSTLDHLRSIAKEAHKHAHYCILLEKAAALCLHVNAGFIRSSLINNPLLNLSSISYL